MSERKNGGIDALIEGSQIIGDLSLRRQYAEWVEAGRSPIEGLFLLGLLVGLDRGRPLWPPHRTRSVRELNPDTFLSDPIPSREIRLGLQVRILDWPVDFLLATANDTGSRHYAVVECDGHEFHERTKDQAERDRSRDRRLQAAGFRVFRFTGSEIHANPLAPAVEIVGWTRSVWGVANGAHP